MGRIDTTTDATTHHSIDFPGTDLKVHAHLENDELIVEVSKGEMLVYRAVVEQATGPLEHAWIADLFMRSDRVRLRDLSAEMDDYLTSLDIAQG